MHFPSPLLPGTLIKRYKRFMADVRLDSGEIVTAHCPNTGAMLGLTDPGIRVWLSPAENPERKLKYTWELCDVDGTFVGIDTNHPNRLAEEFIKSNQIQEITDYKTIKREVKYGKNSRIDLYLENDSGSRCYVEVKNVHLKIGDAALFPDSVTARGVKHLKELTNMVRQGHRAVMFYLVQRDDVSAFSLAKDIDPLYAETATRAFANGVEAIACACRLSPTGIGLDKPLKVILP